MFVKLFILCLAFSGFAPAVLVQAQYGYEGDDCYYSVRGRPGKCTLASQCPEVVRNYQQHGIKPIVCSYQVSDLIVCCPEPDLPVFKPPQQTLDNRGPINGKRRSEAKCEEYSKLAVHTATFTLLSVMTTVDKVSIPTCIYPTGLIVGGEITKPGEFPHMAAIGWSDPGGEIKWNCGGTLISEQFIMTAAHCSAIRGTRPDVVRLGEQNLARDDDKAQPVNYRVIDVISHPNYKHSSHYNDIALIRLNKNVIFTKFIRPACLWQNDAINATKTVASGWGQVEFGGEKSDDLLKVSLDIISNYRCSPMYEPSKRLSAGIVDTQMCAGYLAGGKDTCQGDSGGPIQVLTPSNQCIFHVVGITSFGRACAARNSAGVYTRVSSFLDWIESVVWP